MKLSTLATFLAAAAPTVLAAGCTASQRIATLTSITTAFNAVAVGESAVLIDAFPLQVDCPAIVSVNGAPGIEFGFDATSSKNFAIVVRQAFTNVVSKYTDYGNGTTLMDAQVTLGILHVIDLPAYAHITVPIEFNLTTCEITKLPAFVIVPVDVAGAPINPPVIPVIPGLQTLPGFREVLIALIPVIGNIYNL